MDKRAKRFDRLQNLTIFVLALSFILLLVQTPLFGNASGAAISSAVRGWLTGQTAAGAEEPDSLTALAVPVRTR